MDLTNCSRVTGFILLGFPHFQGMDIPLFVVILLLYLLCITGNGLIIVMVTVDHRLQKPMYFFLSNFSTIVEIGHTTVFMPKMLVNFLSTKNTICFYCCMTQLFFYFLFGVTEFFILAIMSFDRYLAICHPLRYPTLMTSQVCLKLALAAWLAGFFSILFQMWKIVRLPFCSSNVVHHFFCDVGAMLKIAGGDTQVIEALGFVVTVTVILSSLVLTVVIYIFIISTILHITSTSGQRKAFSTCASHLTVVSILYGAVLYIYLRPSVKGSSFGVVRAVSVLNMIIAPVLNPFIYTIRNNEVKDAIRKALGRKTFTVSKF